MLHYVPCSFKWPDMDIMLTLCPVKNVIEIHKGYNLDLGMYRQMSFPPLGNEIWNSPYPTWLN